MTQAGLLPSSLVEKTDKNNTGKDDTSRFASFTSKNNKNNTGKDDTSRFASFFTS